MFFFSSRRRHTRYWRDWSSDVCSSDLDQWPLFEIQCSILPQNKVRIHFSLDLIICDVASLRILMKEWALLYSSMECELPTIDLKFRDYVLAEKKIRDCDVYKTSEAYWDERIKTLSGRPELPLKKGDLSEVPHYRRLSYTKIGRASCRERV